MLYLNEKFFIFGISETSQCSFCNQNNETTEHLLCHCFVAKALRDDLNTFFQKLIFLHDFTPQASFFGFTEKHLDDSILQNHLLLVFKLYLYKSHSYGFVNVFVRHIQISINLTYLNGIILIFRHCFIHGTWDGWVVVDIFNFVFFFFMLILVS